jgi:hypothetical protein
MTDETRRAATSYLLDSLSQARATRELVTGEDGPWPIDYLHRREFTECVVLTRTLRVLNGGPSLP